MCSVPMAILFRSLPALLPSPLRFCDLCRGLRARSIRVLLRNCTSGRSVFNSHMKKFAYIILSIVVVSVLATSSALAQAKKAETTQTAETKITRDAAQQLVMKKYLGAQVISCNLDTVKGNSVWTVKFTRTGANLAETVTVDAQTGKITR